jgi:tetratricopeptide (TPR) repeat protein
VRAQVAADRLDPDEAALAGALVALAEGRFADACAIYRDLLDADAFSFPAWYGLGTCHWRDNLVIPDPASPSGWSFRSSHNAAVAAFGKAFELQPAFVFTFGRDAVTRLEELFHAERHIRAGWDASRQQRFGAFASLAPAGAAAGDTLAFVPYAWEQIVAGDFPPGNAEALERGRETVLATSASLARDFADNPAALLIRAETLEAMQALDGVGAHGSALEWAQRATDAARTPRERAYAALVESRLLLKLGRHADARRIALRIVRDAQTDSMEWEDIAGLAALTGQAHELARLYGQNARELLEQSEFDGVPLSVLEPRQRLIAYAMIGAPPDSVYRLGRELEEKANAWLTPVQLAERRCELIGRPLDVAYPVLLQPIEDEACRPFGRRSMQWADHNEDTRTVLAIMDELDVLRAGDPPNRLALDAVFNEAWLVVRAGDTLRARRNLDASLDALAAIPALRLRQPVAIAGLIRAMALSAELAAAAGDRQGARRWASAVAELWQESDIPELQSLVRSMKALARGP